MLFNSIEFLIFLPLSFILYWFVFKKKLINQNFFLLVISYIFYGWWDWRFLSLIILSSIIDYHTGLLIEKKSSTTKKKFYLALSIGTNLGILGFFKYVNFKIIF